MEERAGNTCFAGTGVVAAKEDDPPMYPSGRRRKAATSSGLNIAAVAAAVERCAGEARDGCTGIRVCRYQLCVCVCVCACLCLQT